MKSLTKIDTKTNVPISIVGGAIIVALIVSEFKSRIEYRLIRLEERLTSIEQTLSSMKEMCK